MLQTNSKLKSHIVSLWNTFWSAGLSNPITAIEQISYFLFIRQLDELEKNQLVQNLMENIYHILIKKNI